MPGRQPAFVYLLRRADGSLYRGWTSDLRRRFEEHAAGRASRYTRSRLPVELAWSAEKASRSDAIRGRGEYGADVNQVSGRLGGTV